MPPDGDRPILIYTGGGYGGSWPNVPARDLMAADLEALSARGMDRDAILATGLYKPAPKPRARAKAKNKED